MKILLATILSIMLISCMEKPSFKNQIDKIFLEFTNQTPGASVLVLQRDSVVFKKGYGLADLEKKI